MKNRHLHILLLMLLACVALPAQVYNEMDADGNITQRDEYGNNGNFNPNSRDSTKANKEIPRGVHVWTVDRIFGDVQRAEVDTMPHLYQNSIYSTGLYGEYNTTGNNYSPRLSRIFIDRPDYGEFFFTQPYDFTTRQPDEFLFVNTLSPYTNISYDNCGDKQHGEDHIDAKFAVNAGKRLGMGFDLEYNYANGYYDSQNLSHFRSTLFASYLGDRYQMHLLGSLYHRKVTENGGIQLDNYITHPESYTTQFTEEEIPTVLTRNWNRSNSQHLFLSHRYNIGFYRKVKMTEEEIKARQFAQKSAKEKQARELREKGGTAKDETLGRKSRDRIKDPVQPTGRPANAVIMGDEPGVQKPEEADTTRIQIASQEQMDSIMAEQARQDSIDATMKREYVPVTSIIHTLDISHHDRIYQAYTTPTDYYQDTFYNTNDEGLYSNDSIFDKTRFLNIKNTLALALLEGFNKYMKAGLKGFVSFDYCKYKMPALTADGNAFFDSWSETGVTVGGQLSKTQGETLHFNLLGELGVTGRYQGDISLNFDTDLNFRLFGDTVQLAATAYFHRLSPSSFMDTYHSKHLWWDQELEHETRTHIEGRFSYAKTNTQLRVAVDEIQHFTYFGMSYTKQDAAVTNLTGGVYQSDANVHVLTAQLRQNFRLGVLNWENVATYQNCNNEDVLPLPSFNLWSNLYLKFRIARVLSIELGGCVTYFSKYNAPDYLPQLSQFAVQQNEDSRVEIGGYPWVDVYANMHLKRARFFVAMSHVNAGTGSKQYFLTPHYPTNSRVLHFGVSWNFYN